MNTDAPGTSVALVWKGLASIEAPQALIRTCYPPGSPLSTPPVTRSGHRVLGKGSVLTQW